MSYEILEAKINLLPDVYVNEVIDFVDFLVAKSNKIQTGEKKYPNRIAGIAKDSEFYIAPDFDEPLECFKDYM